MNQLTDNATELHVLQLVENIDQMGDLVWVAAIGQALRNLDGTSYVPGRVGRSEPFLRHSGSVVIDEPLGSDKRSGAESRLRKIVTDRDISVIFAHDIASLKLARKLAAIRPLSIVLVTNRPWPRPTLFAPTRRLFEHVYRFIVPSSALAEHLHSDHGIDNDRIQIIHEGIDLNETRFENVSSERAASLAQSWGAIEDPSELILIPARFDDEAWVQRFANFTASVAQSDLQSARFVVVGDDDGGGQMRQLQKRMSVTARDANIYFAGHCADLEAAVKLASMILIIDSNTTGNYPLALLAQALGRLVVINGDNPAASEFLVHNHTGYLMNEEFPDLLVEIQRLLDTNEAQRSARTMAANIFLTQNFSREQMQMELSSVVTEMIANK